MWSKKKKSYFAIAMKTLSYLPLILLLFACLQCKSQSKQITPEMAQNVTRYNAKIDELIGRALTNGFRIVREEKLHLRNNVDMLLNISLMEGTWYHFCFIGDPSSTKVKATLFKEGVGDLVQDRIKVKREHEFWTEFSFVCPQSGNYEFIVSQKGPFARPLSYLAVFKKNKVATNSSNE